MEPRELRQETLVEHPELGVGKITRVEREQHRAVVNFRSEPEYRMTVKDALASLEARPAGGLSAHLYESPDDVLSWVADGQLRLVGATLLDLGGAGKTKDLQSRLEKPVLSLVGAKWATWWNKVQPSLKESEYFEFQKPYTYRLQDGVYVEQIPVEPLTATAKVKKTAPTRNVSQDLQLLREAHAAELKQQREQHNADLIQQREGHAADLIQQRENHAADLIQQREAHTVDLQQQREAHAVDLQQQRDAHAADLQRQKDAHAADLGKWKQEEERLYIRIKNLTANREESRLDIRRDMLEAMAATLIILRQGQGDPSSLLRDAEAGIKLALQAGEAQFYGETNQLVEYDPELHESPESLARGETVTIVHPGAFIPGSKTGNYILLKAQVQHRPEENR